MPAENEIGIPKSPVVPPESPYIGDIKQEEHSELGNLVQEGKVAEEIALYKKASRVAKANPELAPHLTPLLKKARVRLAKEIGCFRAVSARAPKVTAQRWASMTVPEKHASMKRLAHRPFMEREGLTKAKVRDGEAFMVYRVDPAKNHSKFYEGLIVPEDGGYRVKRRWGRMTDSGQTGRIDGGKFDTDGRFWFDNLRAAKRELQTHYAKRVSHKYVDAFGRNHVVPGTNKKLPMGQYPVGLADPGAFGWGEQSVQQCIPALKKMVSYLRAAHAEVKATGNSEIIADVLGDAMAVVRDVAHTDSSMARKLQQLIGKPLRRAEGSPRFMEDVDGARMAKELYSIINYVTKQTSYCG